MAIEQLDTNNTFSEWVTKTSELIAVANNITGSFVGQLNAQPFISNTNIVLTGNHASLNVNSRGEINQLYSNTANIVNANVSSKLHLRDVTITGDFLGAPNTAIYTTITAAIDAGIAFSIALG
jgi:hypothetical protein